MEQSLWAAESALPEFPALEQDLQTDVLVIGGGLAGLLCVHRLSRAGVSCALIEADRICRGVSRNTTAKITAQHGLVYHELLKKFPPEQVLHYWQIHTQALEEYGNLAQGMECDFSRQDSFVFSRWDPSLPEREMEALHRLQIPAESIKDLSLPFPVAGAVCFRNQAQFDPLKFAAALCRDLPIYEHTPAREFQGTTVITPRGKIRASKIIVATHFPILNKHGGYFLKLYQQRSYVLALENVPQVSGMYLEADGEGLSLRSAGDILLLGGGSHRTGKPGGGWLPLEATARAFYPHSRERCRWATQDCMSLDGMPYIGPYSKNAPDVYVATGFNKWGMTGSMAAALMLTEQVQGKQTPYDSLFSPSRSMLHPQLFANGLESTLGLLKRTKPRCPHLGCALEWNPWEHSWDCPCHGSRFDEKGTLLDNPATGNLRLE